MTNFVLDTTGLHLVCKHLRARLLSFGLVNVLHQHTLILEDITLGFLVEDVVASYHKKFETITLKGSEKPIHTDVCQSCQPPCTSATASSTLSVSSSTKPLSASSLRKFLFFYQGQYDDLFALQQEGRECAHASGQ